MVGTPKQFPTDSGIRQHPDLLDPSRHDARQEQRRRQEEDDRAEQQRQPVHALLPARAGVRLEAPGHIRKGRS